MRIGSNLSGVDLTAYHNLSRAFDQVRQSSTRLSTMSRINRGSDNPAGLIAVEQLRSELVAIEAAGRNAGRAAAQVHTADAELAEVGDLLSSIRRNVVGAVGGNAGDPEIAAKQIEIDAALEAIHRLGNTTSFDAELSALAGGGTASLASGNFAAAIDALDSAQDQVLSARASLGAFEKCTLEPTQRVLDATEVNVASAISMIGDTDVALEASHLIRSQILADAATSVMMLTVGRQGLIGELFS